MSVFLFLLKILAWYLTSSVAILTDALESTVNVIAGFIGLYSIILSSKPKDKEHPYGHGKVEFISSAIEGVLISVAGIIIIYEALDNFIHPHIIQKLDYGLYLIVFTALINYFVGYYCIKTGKTEGSPVLMASGHHLQSDTYSTLGLVLGILLMIFTGYAWIDGVIAILFAFIILFTGYKIIRKAISGMMDETDESILQEIAIVLENHRLPSWIDIHNMRVINYAGFYHIDCHLTVPYYINVSESHKILDTLTQVLTMHFKERVEFFIHIDGCISAQCSVCQIDSCTFRNASFVKKIQWTSENLASDQKHILE